MGLKAKLTDNADRIGTKCLHLFADMRRIFDLIAVVLGAGFHSGWWAKPAIIHVVIRQIYFTGIQSLPWVILMAIAVGVLGVYNVVAFSRSVGDVSLIGQLIASLLVLEVAPLIVIVLMLSRSGVAVVTELGTMHARGEDLTLKSMGIDVREYLLWPRLLAFTICGLILTFIFAFVSIWLGGLLVSLSYNISFVDFLVEVRRSLWLDKLALLMLKGVLYPMLSIVILLYQGCTVGREPNLIPVHATQGVFGALMTVLMSDSLIALASVV